MPEDLRPLPRLPLDTAGYVAIEESSLDGFITFEPGEPVYKVSLIETQTPNYWASPANRQVYDMDLVSVYVDQQEAEDVVRPVLREFAKAEPRPPQTRVGKVLG